MIKLNEIAYFLGLKLNPEFDNIYVQAAKAITDSEFDAGNIGWCSDKNIDKLATMKGGIVLINNDLLSEGNSKNGKIILLGVDNPRRQFSNILAKFFEKQRIGGIHSTAVIDPSVNISNLDLSIGAHVVIEEGCVLGSGVSIGSNTVIKHDTFIGKRVQIGSNCTIGGVGFGYEQSETGEYLLIPHIGNVVLMENVEIGNNVCIDRAVLGSTRLHKNVKVDNLVHIAHGVEIDENSLIIAHTMVAGSVSIGKNVWIAPSAAIRQKLTIGDNSLVGLGSVVVKNVEEKQTVMGVPAKPLSKK